jgi:uncharacterized membrane protein YkgB
MNERHRNHSAIQNSKFIIQNGAKLETDQERQRKTIRMEGFSSLGKMLIVIGVVIVIIGAVLLLGPKVPWLGRLPGDFSYRGKNFTFYFPLGTSILISIVLTLILWLISKK